MNFHHTIPSPSDDVAIAVVTPKRPRNPVSQPNSLGRDHYEGKTMSSSLGKPPGTLRGRNAHNGRRHGDWLADQLARMSEKEAAAKARMTPKAVGNVRQRRNAMNFDHFTELCIADLDFAAAFAEYVGLVREGEAEFTGALSRAFNAYLRKPKPKIR
jgi:hypothetical protein